MTPRVTGRTADGKINSAVAGGFRRVNMSFVDALRMLVEVMMMMMMILIYVQRIVINHSPRDLWKSIGTC